MKSLLLLLPLILLAAAAAAAPDSVLPGTQPLEGAGDRAAEMVAGIDRFLTRETEQSVQRRERHWKRDFSSPEAYTRSVEPNRERLRKILGVVDVRLAPEMEAVSDAARPAELPAGAGIRIRHVRWRVLPGIDGEGLLLEPPRPVANVVALPDCDTAPEQVAGLAEGHPPFAWRLAENGCRVLVPVLIDRSDTFAGDPAVRMTNQPHREFLYRAAFEMGRHVIGYEVQKVLAAVDWFQRDEAGRRLPVGVIGHGEGGLLALYSAALDPRVRAAVVSGYFGPREQLWREPIYRNVWGLLDEFGDAETATLIAPRALVVRHAAFPRVSGPPAPRQGRSGAAPGEIVPFTPEQARAEARRAEALVADLKPAWRVPVTGGAEAPSMDDATLSHLLRGLGVPSNMGSPGTPPRAASGVPGAEARQKRQLDQLVEHTQRLLRESAGRRAAFWAKADRSSPAKWSETARPYREYLWDEVIGRFPAATLPPNARTRQIYDEPKFRGYEVMLDVWPDVFAYGLLLVPKDLKPGERRPVVVCQHGLEGRPQDVADPKVDHPAYHRYAARLAERGFITFAPQNPYIGQDRFRVLQRKANPLKKSLFSVIVRQHERLLEWLGGQPFVDRERIAFYGLSYGGKTAMRVPAMLEGYCLSICSADYNEWIWKNVSAHDRYSYLFTGEYEMPEFDLGNTFNYAELSWLISPRPFMVERGHEDGVAPDEQVAYEFAKTRRHYVKLGLADRTEIEFFDGPHTIHGVGTFEFLHRHLRWRP